MGSFKNRIVFFTLHMARKYLWVMVYSEQTLNLMICKYLHIFIFITHKMDGRAASKEKQANGSGGGLCFQKGERLCLL